MAKRVVLTGLPGSGKTSLCQKVIEHAQSHQIDLKGVLSPPVFLDDEKIAIDLLDLSTGDRGRLAVLRRTKADVTLLTTRKWAFDLKKMRKGNTILGSSTPCELLVVDELGPLEFVRKEGWQAGLAAVDSRDYQAALVVIRPGLLETAMKRWPDAEKIEITSPDQVPALARQAIQMLDLPD